MARAGSPVYGALSEYTRIFARAGQGSGSLQGPATRLTLYYGRAVCGPFHPFADGVRPPLHPLVDGRGSTVRPFADGGHRPLQPFADGDPPPFDRLPTVAADRYTRLLTVRPGIGWPSLSLVDMT